MSDKIIQCTGFSNFESPNDYYNVPDYYLVAVTEQGRVLMSVGDGKWANVTGDMEPKEDD